MREAGLSYSHLSESHQFVSGIKTWFEYISIGVNMVHFKKIIMGADDTSESMKSSGMIFIENIGYGRTFVGL